MFLCSCSNKVTYVPKVEKQYPPAAYMVACTKPTIGGKTWKAIGQLAIDRGFALDDCASKVDAIIEWSKGR